MKRVITFLASLVLAANLALAGDLVNADAHSKIALQGYDPVAFHTIGQATKGNPAIAAEYRGYKYLFASAENKATFEKQPEKYVTASDTTPIANHTNSTEEPRHAV